MPKETTTYAVVVTVLELSEGEEVPKPPPGVIVVTELIERDDFHDDYAWEDFFFQISRQIHSRIRQGWPVHNLVDNPVD